MLCQKCHKNLATVRYAEVVNGKVTDLHMCPECLAGHQHEATSGFELISPVSPARASYTFQAESTTGAASLCKVCGTRLALVQETGRVGCANCYTLFAEPLEAMLTALHGDVEHRGKSPHVDDVRSRLRAELQTKRTLLRTALEMENYEDAATLRDDIQQLETVLGATLSKPE